MKRHLNKDYFTIPNLMGYFRILILPFFLYLYIHADTKKEFIIAFCLLFLSYLSDFLDGKIARRFHMVTDIGKALDPIADKLTQGTLALALAFRYQGMVVCLILFLLKECYMGVMGLYLIHRGHPVTGALWYGKLCTAVMDLGVLALLLYTDMPAMAANIIITVMICCIIVTFFLYLRYHTRQLK